MNIRVSNNINGFDNALQDAFDYMEDNRIGNLDDPTPIYLLIATNGAIIDDSLGVNCYICSGGTPQDLVLELQNLVNKGEL